MTIIRRASITAWVSCNLGGLSSGNSSKYGSDGHSKTGQVAFAQNISSHYFSSGEKIPAGLSILHQDARVLVYFYAEIGKRNSRPQWITDERWRVDLARPMRFRRVDSIGPAIIELITVECSRLNRAIKTLYRRLQCRGIKPKLPRQFSNRVSANRGEYRWHEEALGLGVHDRVCNLLWPLCHKSSPDRVALRPHVLTLIVKTLGLMIDHDAKRYAIETRHNSAVKFRCARIDGHRMALLWVADSLGATP